MAFNQLGFVISSGAGYSEKANSSMLLNLYAHQEETGAKFPIVLMNTPGSELASLQTFNSDIIGLEKIGNLYYLVTKTEIHSYDTTTKVFTKIGNVSFVGYAEKVFIAYNGIDIVFVGGGIGYYYNTTDGLVNYTTEAAWYPSDSVCFLDGFFVFNRSGTGQFFSSKQYTHELDALDWATAESSPDTTMAVYAANRQLWIFGTNTVEIWYNAGDALFPFARVSGAVTDIGLLHQNTLASIYGSVLFVGSDYKVYMTAGYIPTLISTPAIEIALEHTLPTVLNAFTYHEDGHYFYVLHISDTITYVFDATTRLWHRRSSYDTVSGTQKQWEIRGAVQNYENRGSLGYSKTSFLRVATDIYLDNGVTITREATSMPLSQSVERVTISAVQLDMQAGGYQFHPLSNFRVGLRTSKDDGHTWGNLKTASIGKDGAYTVRALWRRLGQFRDIIIKISITDPIPIRILGLFVRT